MRRTIVGLSPQEGYDKAADIFDGWYWTQFWKRNERPLVNFWMDLLRQGTVLDAGSGTGNYVPDFKERGQQVVSLDISRRMLFAQAGKLNTISRLIQGDISRSPIRSESIDAVLCARVLSHVRDVKCAIGEFGRIVRRGGSVLLTDVHPDHPYDKVTISNGKRIPIRIWKHSLADVRRAILREGDMEIRYFREFGLDDLCWRPPVDRFRDVYSGNLIFYICLMQRR